MLEEDSALLVMPRFIHGSSLRMSCSGLWSDLSLALGTPIHHPEPESTRSRQNARGHSPVLAGEQRCDNFWDIGSL